MPKGDKTMACQCRICDRHRKFKAWLATIPETSKEFANDLMTELDHAEDDANYWHSIVDGSWPSADEVIERKRRVRKDGVQKEAGGDQDVARPEAG